MMILWIEEAKQFLLVVLAELCSHAHVPNHRPGDPGRETLGSVMAARAVLRKDALALTWRLFIVVRCALRLRGIFLRTLLICC